MVEPDPGQCGAVALGKQEAKPVSVYCRGSALLANRPQVIRGFARKWKDDRALLQADP